MRSIFFLSITSTGTPEYLTKLVLDGYFAAFGRCFVKHLWEHDTLNPPRSVLVRLGSYHKHGFQTERYQSMTNIVATTKSHISKKDKRKPEHEIGSHANTEFILL